MELLGELEESRIVLETARAELAERERIAAETERAAREAARAEADRREGLARLAGQVDTMRIRVESIEDEGVMRLSVNIEEAAAKAQQAQAEFETVQSRVSELDAGEVGLDEQHDRSVTALRLADERVAELQTAERAAERQVASLRARIEALSVSLDRRDGAAWLQKNHSGAGLFGSIGEHLKVRPGRGGGGHGAGCGSRRVGGRGFRGRRGRRRRSQGNPTAAGRRCCSGTGRPTARPPRGCCPTVRSGPTTWSPSRIGCAVRSPRCSPEWPWWPICRPVCNWCRRDRTCVR